MKVLLLPVTSTFTLDENVYFGGGLNVMFQYIINNNLSVRETEKLVRSLSQSSGEKSNKKSRKTTLKQKDTDTMALEAELSSALGVSVLIEHSSGNENGSIILKYKTLEEFERVREVLIGTR